jgi:glycosyltransferase involved in cell wall biosynthesis
MTSPPTPSAPRIACLATHGGEAGGAAIAMERLVAGLRRAGAHVDVMTRDACEWPAGVRHLDRRIRRQIRHGRTPHSNTLFTADWPAWDLADHPAITGSDLVNVHWVAGFLGAEGLRRIVLSGRSVAWTLHDMRAFTGGCHYSAGCDGFTADCAACPQLVPALRQVASRSLGRARRRLHGLPLTFVTPSHWLASELVRSSLFDPEAHAVRVIPNGIDLARFRPGDRTAARARLGLPTAGLGILLGSVSLEERRKGGDAAVAAIQRMAADLAADPTPGPPPIVVTYGGGGLELPGVACRHLGPVDSSGVLEAIHASDVHLTMAREDNLPNTVMEALACGVPVVATRAGGLPEMIREGYSGWLVGVDDAAQAAAVLAALARRPAQATLAGQRARRQAETDWDLALQSGRYLDLAAELNDRHRCSRPLSRGEGLSGPTTCLTPAVARLAHPVAGLRGPLRRARRLAAVAARPAARTDQLRS